MAILILGLCLVALLFTGCCLFDAHIVDGPGMVNYNGILLDALIGDWSDGEKCCHLKIGGDYTISVYRYDVPLLENAGLTLHAASEDTSEYSDLDVSPNTWTEETGNSVEITRAYHENGTITLELAFADGAKKDLDFQRECFMLDGPGMMYEGGPLDEALTGCWCSIDGRFVLDFEGKCADFSVDGKMLSSKDEGYYFVDHDFSAKDDLNERCELLPFGGPEIMDETYETILTIDEMWYQAEHIYMNITWPDGKPESIVFSKQNDSMPTGEWEAEQTPESPAKATPEPTPVAGTEPEQRDGIVQITMETQEETNI